MEIRNTDSYEKSNKNYKKALKYYNNGQLEKALEICVNEEERVLYNPSFLNLKGLLYYLKGDMNEARKCWNINYLKCKDKVAEKYLFNSKNDEDLWKLYIKGLKYEKDLNINEAIFALEQCKHKSDFNTINVNNALCKCYIEKCNYDEAILCMKRVLSIDCKNDTSLQYKKTLIELGVLPRNRFKIFIPISIVATSLLLIFLVIMPMGKKISNKFVSKKNNENVEYKEKEHKTDEVKKLEEQIKKIENAKKDKEEDKKEDKKVLKFPMDDVTKYIEGKNYKELNSIIEEWKGKEKQLNTNEVASFNKAKAFMNSYAGQYFYNLGRNNSKDGKFREAIEYYNMGISYGIGVFPYEDNLYMLGLCYNKISDIENSIKIFERYYNEYKNKKIIREGNYIEDVLRYLVNMYKDLNNEKYKTYEKELNLIYKLK